MAKPSSGLNSMDKARLVLMKKEGLISDGGAITPDALKKYKDLYKEDLPLHFIEAVSAGGCNGADCEEERADFQASCWREGGRSLPVASFLDASNMSLSRLVRSSLHARGG